MKRIALETLVKWNDKSNRKPLIIWGARQVGKTYLIKELFANKYYPDNYIYIDFHVEDEIRELCANTANAKRIIEIIETSKGKKITDNTLLIFDEVQEYPNIISSLKYFCQDFRQIPVIATGSMVRMKLNRETKKRGNGKTDFLFPVGKINQLTIYPLTFEEYLLNCNEPLLETLREYYTKKEPTPSHIHTLALNEIYTYLFLGGMPEVVDNYLKHNDRLESIATLEEIYDNYLADMSLYQASSESAIRCRSVFANIYNQLNKESKNFSASLIQKDSKIRDYKSPIEWLVFSDVALQSKQLKERIVAPLTGESESNFRLYFADMGIFTYQSKINAATFLSKEVENKLSGIFFENFVACELAAKDIELFYWKGKNRFELEFIVQSNGEIYPIDAKKSKGVLGSIEEFSNHNKYKIAIKVSSNNYGYNEATKLLTIPYYFVPFLANDLKNGISVI